jgi:hypothetical protein
MMWAISGSGPALFLGRSPEYVKMGGGIMGFDKSALTDWRRAVDGALGDDLRQGLDDLAAVGLVAAEPELKRVPAPFDKDHRHGDLLGRKSLTLWRDVPPSQYDAPQAVLANTFAALRPMLDLLQRSL